MDVTDSYDDDFTLCLPPIGSGVIYVEVRLNCAWLGTCLIIHGLRAAEFELGGSHGGDIVRLVVEDAEVQGLVIPSLGVNSWSWCNDPVTFGVLVDMVRGCVTFRLNGLDGPCVRFPGAEWRSGVQVLVEEWPSPAVIDRDLPRVAVSCATPPPPPSLLVAAEEPMTVEDTCRRTRRWSRKVTSVMIHKKVSPAPAKPRARGAASRRRRPTMRPRTASAQAPRRGTACRGRRGPRGRP